MKIQHRIVYDNKLLVVYLRMVTEWRFVLQVYLFSLTKRTYCMEVRLGYWIRPLSQTQGLQEMLVFYISPICQQNGVRGYIAGAAPGSQPSPKERISLCSRQRSPSHHYCHSIQQRAIHASSQPPHTTCSILIYFPQAYSVLRAAISWRSIRSTDDQYNRLTINTTNWAQFSSIC